MRGARGFFLARGAKKVFDRRAGRGSRRREGREVGAKKRRQKTEVRRVAGRRALWGGATDDDAGDEVRGAVRDV